MDIIRDHVTLILIANDKTILSKIKLFKLMLERIDNASSDIHIKEKYAIVFRSLPIDNDDIYFYKSDNFIVYNPDIIRDSNKLIIDENNDELLNLYNFVDDKYDDDDNNKFITKNKMYDYIVENMDVQDELNRELSYRDPQTGNTIYHDIIIENNVKIIDKLIKANKMSLFVENNKKETPLNLINDNKIFIKIIDHLSEQNNNLKSIIKNNESRIKILKKNNKKSYYYYMIIVGMFLPIIINYLYTI